MSTTGIPSGDNDLLIDGQRFTLDLEDPTPADGGGQQTTQTEGGTQGGAAGAGEPAVPENIAKMISESTRRAVEAEQRAQRAEQLAEELKRSQAQPFIPGQTQPQITQQQMRDQLAKTLGEKLITDPGGTLADMLLMQQQIAQSSAQSVASGVASNQADLIINGFLQEKAADPSWNLVKDSFMAQLDEARKATTAEQLARATPQQIRDSLTGLYERAAGRAALTSFAQRNRDTIPPAYSTGSAGSAGGARLGGNGAPGKDEMQPRDAVEKEMIESGRGYGLKDDHILAALRAYREDNG